MTTRWQRGPWLPVEFARKSADGRLTLVLYGNHLVSTFWTMSRHNNIDDACENLRQREGNAAPGDIHYTTGGGLRTCHGAAPNSGTPDVSAAVETWLCARSEIDAAVWTGLPARGFTGLSHQALTREALAYATGLTGEVASRAEEYVRRAPATVHTPVRAALERAPLRWLPAEPR